MSFAIVFAPVVLEDDVPALGRDILTRAREAIDTKLKTQPAVFGKPLRHSLRNYRALRVGDFRVVYRIDAAFVRIIAIVHRRDVYRVAQMRVR